MKKIKWFTISEHVDIETGEIITKKEFEKNYYKVGITKKTEINENNGIIKYTTESRRTNQTRIWE